MVPIESVSGPDARIGDCSAGAAPPFRPPFVINPSRRGVGRMRSSHIPSVLAGCCPTGSARQPSCVPPPIIHFALLSSADRHPSCLRIEQRRASWITQGTCANARAECTARRGSPRDRAHRATGFTARRGSPRDGVLLDPSNDPYPTRPLSLPCRSPDEAFRSNQVLGSAAESGARRERGDGLGRRSREGDRRGNVARRTRGRPRGKRRGTAVGLPESVSGVGGVVASPES